MDERPGDHLSGRQAATLATSGAVLVASAFLSWVARGSGSSMSLREVGDVVLGDRWSSTSRWLGLLAYVVPVAGGLAIVAAGFPATRARRAARILASIVGLLLTVAVVGMIVRHRAPASGFFVAVVGDAAMWWFAIGSSRNLHVTGGPSRARR